MNFKFKFLSIVILSITLLNLFQTSFAFADNQNTNYYENLAKKVFQINTYKYNEITDNYQTQQYGSAVLIWKNLLLTNAHVIVDENWKPTWLHEACMTTSSKEAPSCFSDLKVLKYDNEKDLALLLITNTKYDVDPVELSNEDIEIGSDIDIIWYPYNGWETISITKWSVSGKQDWNYKTDANLDSGNSWGWGFNEDGEFIGIPTFVIEWYSSMWYIIWVNEIKNFLITNKRSFSKKNENFTNFLAKKYLDEEKEIIDNDVFKNNIFSEFWFSIEKTIEKNEYWMFLYLLTSWDNYILISVDRFSKKGTSSSIIKMNEKSFNNIPGVKKTSISKKLGKNIWKTLEAEASSQIFKMYTIEDTSWGTAITIVTNTNDKEIINNIDEIVWWIEIKNLKKPEKSITFPNVDFSRITNRNIWILKAFDTIWNLSIYLLLNDYNDWISLSLDKVINNEIELKDSIDKSAKIASLLWAENVKTIEKSWVYSISYEIDWNTKIVTISKVYHNWNEYLIQAEIDFQSNDTEKEFVLDTLFTLLAK